jgi:electron transport complex protein RnfB
MLTEGALPPAATGHETLTIQIDALLPQTQCGKCGYPGCWPYAEAIVRGEADINQCPPGGGLVIGRLAALLRRDPKPLNPIHGVHRETQVAVIDEARCIGCTKCIQACPVDAILGAAKLMHTVIEELCTGCELCLPPCPVDCIELVPAHRVWTQDQADAARVRFNARNLRLMELPKSDCKPERPAPKKSKEALREEVRASIQRARQKHPR